MAVGPDWFVCTAGPQVLETVVEYPLPPTNPQLTAQGQAFKFMPAPVVPITNI